MKFRSTRNASRLLGLSDALRQGLAPDGGLYVPESMPLFATGDADTANFQEIARMVLAPFFEGDVLEPHLGRLVDDAFNFPVPLIDIGHGTSLLELFHGPSAAFKDFGARFLASAISDLEVKAEKPLTILVATSGDTGGAVAAAFWRKPGVKVVVLYPEGKVSARQ
jgi:threonine synthase